MPNTPNEAPQNPRELHIAACLIITAIVILIFIPVVGILLGRASDQAFKKSPAPQEEQRQIAQ